MGKTGARGFSADALERAIDYGAMALAPLRTPTWDALVCLLVVCACSGENTSGPVNATSGTATLDGGSATATTTGSSASNDVMGSTVATATSTTGATTNTGTTTTSATAAGGAAPASTSATAQTSSAGTGASTSTSDNTGAGGAAATLTTGQSAGGANHGAGGSAAVATDTWTNFAAGFFQTYCVMCHNQDNAGDASRDYTQLSVVSDEADSIACGVATVTTRATLECAPGAPSAEQFPNPAGGEPSVEERERLVAWILAGMPE